MRNPECGRRIDHLGTGFQPVTHGQDAQATPLRVFLAGKLTALAAPGGGEIQMRATAEALRGLGIAARTWRPWEDNLADCDLLHLFEVVRDVHDADAAVPQPPH